MSSKPSLSSVVNCVRKIRKMRAARNELSLPREDLKRILRPLYTVASFIGNRNKDRPWLGMFGLVLWIANILIHFSLDFYEASHKYGWAWATAIAVFFISFASGTYTIIRETIPWIGDALEILYVDGNFSETLEKARKVTKVGDLFFQFTSKNRFFNIVLKYFTYTLSFREILYINKK